MKLRLNRHHRDVKAEAKAIALSVTGRYSLCAQARWGGERCPFYGVAGFLLFMFFNVASGVTSFFVSTGLVGHVHKWDVVCAHACLNERLRDGIVGVYACA